MENLIREGLVNLLLLHLNYVTYVSLNCPSFFGQIPSPFFSKSGWVLFVILLTRLGSAKDEIHRSASFGVSSYDQAFRGVRFDQ